MKDFSSQLLRFKPSKGGYTLVALGAAAGKPLADCQLTDEDAIHAAAAKY